LHHVSLSQLCDRFEQAQAAQSAGWARASGGRVLELPSATAIGFAAGHPLNQGLALGLAAPCTSEDLDHLEAFLGSNPVVEVTPGASEGTLDLLQARGYRIRQFQQVWHRDLRDLPLLPALPGLDIRPVGPGEAELYDRLVMGGFMDQDDLASLPADQLMPMGEGSGTLRVIAFLDGVPAGGGAIGLMGPIVPLSGTSVLPRFRGLGLQKHLILSRLQLAAARGATEACSATLPATASQHSLVGMGFLVAYPKLEMARG
jgi:GNAT superfamily N-acetyltransferase